MTRAAPKKIKKLNRPIAGRAEALLLAVDQTPNLVAIFDEDDQLLYCNTAFRTVYGFDKSLPQDWHSIIRNAHLKKCGPIIDTNCIEDWLTRADTRRGTLPFRSFEADFHDGRWMLVTETMQPNGSLLLIATDITAIRTDERALRSQRDKAVRAAWTDPLTGLANRRYCLEYLRSWYENPSGDDHGALAMIDLDHFKQVNDVHGHEFGDRVLVDFGRFILDRIRLRDLFGRIGGEEFLLFMPGCPMALARTRMEALIAGLESHSAIEEVPDFRYSFSCGLVSITSAMDLDDGLNTADQLLYRAKVSGRGCVVVDE